MWLFDNFVGESLFLHKMDGFPARKGDVLSNAERLRVLPCVTNAKPRAEPK